MKQNADRSFFLYLSHFYVHTPVKSPTSWLHDKYSARISSSLPNAAKRREYAAFVESLDHYVGEILSALDQADVSQKTLVVFTSDNGGHPEYAANGPLRGSKWNLYEGGIRVPCIARWPGVIPPGSVCDEPVTGTDLLPTFCDVAGVETSDATLDGASIVPLLRDNAMESLERSLIWHFPYYHPEKGFEKSLSVIGTNDFAVSQTRPVSAIRDRRYKLIRFHEDDRVELYDLESDPGEQHDLSTASSQIAERLNKVLADRLSSMKARFPQKP